MKRAHKVAIATGLSLCIGMSAALVGCDFRLDFGSSSSSSKQDPDIMAVYTAYAASAGDDALSYEEWYADLLATAKGEKGENGEKGEAGKSAYEIWLDNGHEGSETDFLDWLKGATGQTGASGFSAGTGAPSGTASEGSVYLDKSTYDLWQYGETGWAKIGNMKGEDGVSPEVDIGEDGNWYVNGENTGVRAEFEAPTMTIDDEGFWVVNGVRTNINIFRTDYSRADYRASTILTGSQPVPGGDNRLRIASSFRVGAGTKITYVGPANTYKWAVVETVDHPSNAPGSYYDSGWNTGSNTKAGWVVESGTPDRTQYTMQNEGRYFAITIAWYANNNKMGVGDVPNILDLFEIEGTRYMDYTFNEGDTIINGAYNEYAVNSVNHRGYGTAPENTLSAYRLSAQMGFTMVECDVSFTKDGYPVLLHDNTVDRTSNGTGAIGDLTFEQVRSYDFGSWKSSAYAGEKIPTFEEFIALCKNLSLHPYIEIKAGATAEQAKSLVQTVIRYGMRDKVTWISFNYDALQAVVAAYPAARVGYILSKISAAEIAKAKALETGKNEVFIDADHAFLDDAAVELCIDALLPLEVWTMDNETNILNLINKYPYISGVTSNLVITGLLLAQNAR